jgi:hypothetical protein
VSTIEKNRRCWRMIGGILVEKDLDTVKKDLDSQIINVNQFYLFSKIIKRKSNLLIKFFGIFNFIK